MKAVVRYSCGHEGTVELFGNSKDRDRAVYGYENYRVCPACEAAAAAKGANENKLADLVGSEKQVAWANTIRHEKYAEFTRVVGGMVEDMIEKLEEGAVPEKEINNVNDNIKYYGIAVEVLKNKTSASWWIDNRKTDVKAYMYTLRDEIYSAELLK